MNVARKMIVGTGLLLAVGGLSATAVAKAKGKEAVITPAADIKWEPYAPGVPLQVGQQWGDRMKGKHGMFLKLPAGFDSGMHSHTSDYYAVLVQGTWVHTVEGDTNPPKELTVGSYVFQPGKQNHSDLCKSKIDCITFIYQDAKGDFIPAKAEKTAAKPADKAAEKPAAVAAAPAAAPAAPAKPAAAPAAPAKK
jgi:hypothetical protein